MDPSQPNALSPSQIPTQPAPPGITSNLIDPVSIAPAVRITIGVLLGLMLVNVVARFYTRAFIIRSIGADDYFCAVAVASVITFCGLSLSVLGPGLGPHQWDVPLSSMTTSFMEKSTALCLIYAVCSIFIKTSLLVLYRRIFQPFRTTTIVIWCSIAFIFITYTALIVISAVFCASRQGIDSNLTLAQFYASQSMDKCNKPMVDLSIAQGIISLATDLFVFFFPVPMIWRLSNLPTARKISVSAVFLAGLVAIGCCAASNYTRLRQRETGDDYSWSTALNLLLAVVELNIGIICGCLPVGFLSFKRAAISGWGFIRSLSSSSQTLDPSEHGSEVKGPREVLDRRRDELPRIPRAIMTGLRTFIGAGSVGGSKGSKASTQVTVNSIPQDYHQYMRNS
ncbi:hypothetical protein CDD81_5348 [Ophiocordyceps australis]|uniref:Rhodopsin domain-containing protein n=1 Tax=Ophiocordyceps australis TaxID=1399860 RepID=A0A2C5Y8Y3_9HYPO|nr:hypothetical protein CDD81_5348 [Ophiocordyceps australis]